MAKSTMVTNEQILTAAGVTAEEIAQIKNYNALTNVNYLDPIYQKLMSYVSDQREVIARLNNPLSPLEKGYTQFTNGSYNGMFQEVFVQARDKGADNLYGGVKRTKEKKKTPRNPWTSPDYGKDPLNYVYGINASIARYKEYNRNDFLMSLMNDTLDGFIRGQLAVLEAESGGTLYAIENNVINCEAFQYTPYASAPVFTDAYELDSFIWKVIDSQRYPEANMEFKKAKFNTTRNSNGATDWAIIINSEFFYNFAQRFQFAQNNKPIIYTEQDNSGEAKTTKEIARVLRVNELTPTTIGSSGIFDPLDLQAATLPANTKLVGRIITFDGVKFGRGMKNATSYPLDARISHYDEVSDYCFNYCDAYMNVPLLINTQTFDANRKFYTVDATPTQP